MIPLALCAASVPVPPPGPDQDYTCDKPLSAEFVLLDGGALDKSLKAADQGAFLEGGQSASRGLSFLGAEFFLRLIYNDNTSNWLELGQFAFTEWRMMLAIVKREWEFDQATGAQVPGPLPNLFSQDERFVGEVLYRWPIMLGPIISSLESQPAFVADKQYVDSSGGFAHATVVVGDGTEQVDRVFTAAATQNVVHHRVRGRRFLDEEHYLSLCLSLFLPVQGSAMIDSTAIGVEAYGLMKTRSR